MTFSAVKVNLYDLQQSAIKINKQWGICIFSVSSTTFPRSPLFRVQCGKSGGEGPGTRGGPRFSSVPHRAWCQDKNPETHNSQRIWTLSKYLKISFCFSLHVWSLVYKILAAPCPKKAGQLADRHFVSALFSNKWPPENRNVVGTRRELPRCCLRPGGVKLTYKSLNTRDIYARIVIAGQNRNNYPPRSCFLHISSDFSPHLTVLRGCA